jgi:hypothetical protein
MNKPLVGILLAGIAGGYFVGLYLAPVGDEGRMVGMVVGLLIAFAVYLYLRAPGA